MSKTMQMIKQMQMTRRLWVFKIVSCARATQQPVRQSVAVYEKVQTVTITKCRSVTAPHGNVTYLQTSTVANVR